MADDSNEGTTGTDDGASATDDTQGQADLGDAGKKAIEEERKGRRDAERARKATDQRNAALTAELEKVRKANMTEQELLVTKAREEGAAEARQSVLKEVGGRLVDAHLTAALAGRMDEDTRTALLEGLDRTRFLTDAGDVDTKALGAWVNRVAPAPTGRPPLPDRSQGQGTGRQSGSMDDLIRQAAGITVR